MTRVNPHVQPLSCPTPAPGAGTPANEWSRFSPQAPIHWDPSGFVSLDGTLPGPGGDQPFRVMYDAKRNVVVGFPMLPNGRPDTHTPMPVESVARFIAEIRGRMRTDRIPRGQLQPYKDFLALLERPVLTERARVEFNPSSTAPASQLFDVNGVDLTQQTGKATEALDRYKVGELRRGGRGEGETVHQVWVRDRAGNIHARLVVKVTTLGPDDKPRHKLYDLGPTG